jgi:hypothetical protein
MAVPATWPCLSVTRACCALVPARRSYPFATRARSLFLLVCYSYSSRYSLLLLLATPTWRKYEHPRARALPWAPPPTGTGTALGAPPGLPLCCSCPYPSMCSYPCLSLPDARRLGRWLQIGIEGLVR